MSCRSRNGSQRRRWSVSWDDNLTQDYMAFLVRSPCVAPKGSVWIERRIASNRAKRRQAARDNSYYMWMSALATVPVRAHHSGVGVMRVPDEILKCVAFVGYDEADGRHQAGTAFFCSRQLTVPGRLAVYVVTAKHVIDGIRQCSINGKAYLRMNSTNAGLVEVEIPLDAWVSDPDDPYLDVAVLSWAPPEEVID